MSNLDSDRAASATDAQFQLVMAELKAIAITKLSSEPASITLQPTALVNEVYLRLKKGQPLQWNDTHHFLVLAARAMQWILIDHARKKNNLRNGGQWQQVTIEHAEGEVSVVPELVDLHEVLADFEQVDARAYAIVQLYFFGGRTFQEVADHLQLSLSQVKRDWDYARAWLQDRLRPA